MLVLLLGTYSILHADADTYHLVLTLMLLVVPQSNHTTSTTAAKSRRAVLHNATPC